MLLLDVIACGGRLKKRRSFSKSAITRSCIGCSDPRNLAGDHATAGESLRARGLLHKPSGEMHGTVAPAIRPNLPITASCCHGHAGMRANPWRAGGKERHRRSTACFRRRGSVAGGTSLQRAAAVVNTCNNLQVTQMLRTMRHILDSAPPSPRCIFFIYLFLVKLPSTEGKRQLWMPDRTRSRQIYAGCCLHSECSFSSYLPAAHGLHGA